MQRRSLVVLCRVLVAVGGLAAIALIADPAMVWARLTTVSPGAVLAALALHAAIIAALAWRWMALVRSAGLPLPYRDALRLTFLSTTLNMVLPTSVGGDVGRVLLGRRLGIDLANGTVAALLDRAIGLLTLMLVVALPMIFVPGLYPGAVWWLAAVALAAGIGLVALRLADRLPLNAGAAGAIGSMRSLLRKPGLLSWTAAVSLASHTAAGVIAAQLALGMGLDAAFSAVVVLFPAAILATLIPVSVGGWGVRELAAVPLLHQAGIGADAAAAIALVFGITQLMAAALGTAILSLRGAGEAPQRGADG